jgi:hypothetical protein
MGRSKIVRTAEQRRAAQKKKPGRKPKPRKRGGARPGAGAKPHSPDPNTQGKVEALALAGIDREIIARVVGMAPETLRKHYVPQLEKGPAMALATVARNLFKQASKDDFRAVDAAKYYLSRRGGEAWKDKQAFEHSGPNGGPIETTTKKQKDAALRAALRADG